MLVQVLVRELALAPELEQDLWKGQEQALEQEWVLELAQVQGLDPLKALLRA